MAESDSLHDLLQCSVCLDRFTQPKMLPCQHTFCLNCLRGIVKDAKVLDCPQCRESHPVPANGVPGFKDNLMAKSFLSVFGEAASCFDCRRTLNLYTCQHCQEEVCSDCRACHSELAAGITMYMEWADGAKVNRDKDKETADSWKQLLAEIAEAKTRLTEIVDDVIQKVMKRKEEIAAFLNLLETRVRFLVDPQKSKASIPELGNYKTKEALNELKNRMTDTEKLLDRMREDRFKTGFQIAPVELPGLESIGRVEYRDSVFEITSSDFLDQTKTEAACRETLPPVVKKENPVQESGGGAFFTRDSKFAMVKGNGSRPTGVNYKAKNSTMKFYIERHIDMGKTFLPINAVFSETRQNIYCISEGAILVYALQGAGGKKLSPNLSNAKDIALNESDKLVIAEGSVVTIVDLKASEVLESVLVQIVAFDKISNVSQVCCHGKELVVMDIEKKCLKTFTEDGKFLREFGADRIKINNDKNKMCVDQEGRIYVTGMRIVRKESDTLIQNCVLSDSVTVDVKWVIVVFSWDGEFVEEIEIDIWSECYKYTFDTSRWCMRCGRRKDHDQRNESSVPSDETILLESGKLKTIGGICIDAEGYISITRTTKNCIEVLDPKRRHHCIIGDQERRPGEFKEPSGVSLMPDGRLIVCDTGNKRIQII